jgi:oligosaccharide repeat unit polymerase
MYFGIAVLIALAMVLLAVFSQRQEHRWLAPDAFFCLLWGLYCGVSLAFVSQPERHIPGLLWILLSCVCVFTGSTVARSLAVRTRLAAGSTRLAVRGSRGNGASKSDRPAMGRSASEPARVSRLPQAAPTRRVRLPAFRSLTILLVLMGLGEIVFIFAQRGVSLQGILSLSAVAQVSAANRVEFTYGDRRQSTVEWVVFVLVYAGTLFGGAFFRFARTWTGKLVSLLTVINAATFAMLYGSRMGVLFGGSFWIAAFLAAHVLEAGARRKSDLRLLLRILSYSGAILLGFSIITMSIRYQLLDAPRALGRHLSETFVFVPAFCEWFADETATDPWLSEGKRLWGFRSFWKLYELCGVIENPEAPIPVEATSSNIFTVFRGLIEDFGPVGSCLVLFAFGAASSLSYLAVQHGRASLLPALIVSYAYTFLSTSFSLFTYNAPNLALLIFTGYFLLRRIHHSPRAFSGPRCYRRVASV